MSELPLELFESAGLSSRVYDRGGEREVRFYWRAVPALLPVWWNGKLQVVKWGEPGSGREEAPTDRVDVAGDG